jgi:hypothetical protein
MGKGGTLTGRTRRRAPALALAIAILPFPDRPLVDGRIGAREWPALARRAPPEGEVAWQVEDGRLELVVRTDVTLPVHFYVLDGDTLSILHASASLGTAVYRRDGELWRRDRPFAWALRHAALGEAEPIDLARDQREHLRRERWVASTAVPGDDPVVEWLVDRGWLARPGVRFAVSYFAGGESAAHLRHWPAGARVLGDVETERALLIGELPETLTLAPAGWLGIARAPGH